MCHVKYIANLEMRGQRSKKSTHKAVVCVVESTTHTTTLCVDFLDRWPLISKLAMYFTSASGSPKQPFESVINVEMKL